MLLFIKYVSDKCAGQPYAPISIPDGASFRDLVVLKGKPDIGDQINKRIIGPLAKENRLFVPADSVRCVTKRCEHGNFAFHCGKDVPSVQLLFHRSAEGFSAKSGSHA